MRARYYDPQIGRFASQDPAKLEKNFFAYAENNPISKVDANGRLTIEEWQAWMQNWQDIELGVGGTARNPGVGSLADVVRAAGGSIQILMKLDFDFEATAANGIGISSTTAAYAAYRASVIQAIETALGYARTFAAGSQAISDAEVATDTLITLL